MKGLKFHTIPKKCISLKRSTERRKAVKKEFKKAAITNVSFVNAIDKKNVIVPELSAKLTHQPKYAPGVYACAQSHLMTMEKFFNFSDWDTLCIFEDDVIFADDFAIKIKCLESIIKEVDFDFIALGGHWLDKAKLGSQATEHNMFYKIQHMGGTYAYIITRKVAEFILRNYTYNYGMDEFYSIHLYHRFNCYALTPFPVGVSNAKSEITEGSTLNVNAFQHFAKRGQLTHSELGIISDMEQKQENDRKREEWLKTNR